ncbi:hypothetical protein O6H91_09G077100 [Diphasiastrum complanatum]|uniref:Uncharacterized protein n=2 Tax=Diphasiastrum complanatum TaxID=34168 RepID=A0ACC2CR38_DIPCM|nr:hypothetical protein O6H91_09G077100 [Diphasiastrum complanatum]KAJ7544392.1 hypothetical protein O6H91_09G077100 [Diphasiastrum complanatum]
MGSVLGKRGNRDGGKDNVDEDPGSNKPLSLPLAELPEDCLACILSHMIPRDVCRLAVVSRAFWEASKSDMVWERMLPVNYQETLKQARGEPPRLTSKRELYDCLCQKVLLKDGKQALWLDRATGGVCYVLSARALNIAWGSDPRYWEWHPQHGSRFHEVAYLRSVCRFEVSGSLRCYLQPGAYTVSFRLQLGDEPSNMGLHSQYVVSHVRGWKLKPVKFSLSTSDGQHTESERYLDCTEVPESKQLELSNLSPKRIVDNHWVEYDVGEFNVESTHKLVELQFSMTEIEEGYSKSGLFLDGAIIRPSFLLPYAPNSHCFKG